MKISFDGDFISRKEDATVEKSTISRGFYTLNGKEFQGGFETMKEITITTTTTVKIPTADEIKATARIPSPIEPERALVAHCFVDGYEFGEAASRAVYECMAEADESLRNTIASDVVEAYCDENGIQWASIRIVSIAKYDKHFVIEAIVKTI